MQRRLKEPLELMKAGKDPRAQESGFDKSEELEHHPEEA